MISKLLNIFYPSTCPICESKSDSFLLSPICYSCWSKIKKYTGPSCKICAMPLSSEYSEICGQCMKELPPFSKVINYGLYDGELAEAVNQLKFQRVKRLSKPLAELMLTLPLPVTDGIVPVPLSIKRLRERGFNQSLLLARTISKKVHIPFFIDILFKKKETLPQIGLTAKERYSNLKNSFETKKM